MTVRSIITVHVCTLLALLIAGVSALLLCQTSTITILHKFNGADGDGPYGLVQGNDGSFYGTTEQGGAYDRGTIFKMSPTGDLTTIYTFSSKDGDRPFGLIQGPGGDFFGTTGHWETSGFDSTYDPYIHWNKFGTVFKITSSGKLTTLHTFSSKDGDVPAAGLLLSSDGNFYGSTLGDFEKVKSTIFRMTPSGKVTTLHTFVDSRYWANGGHTNPDIGPEAGLVEGSGGVLFGTTPMGGSDDEGSIFKISGVGVLTTLHSFDGFGLDAGAYPAPGTDLIRGRDGNYYGTTENTIFRMSSSGILTTLYAGNHLDGIIQARDGTFYGATENGGDNEFGTLIRFTPQRDLGTLYSFGEDGQRGPYALTQGKDGSIYGTCYLGGGGGEIFKITSSNLLARSLSRF